jgi:tRNA(Ile)-lysidine synthase
VSGGPDSTALLVLAVEAGLDVTAAHVDHGLRPGSAAEAEVVRATAERYSARFVPRAVTVEPGPNVEARARAARAGVLPRDALTGHTADDQAETVVLNLLRGAGLDGLRAMRSERHPLLALRRTETRALCDALDLVTVDDPMNRDPAVRRVRVRHDVIPLLNEVAARDIVPIVVRQAEVLGDDAALLDELAAAIDPTDARALATAPPALARRAIRAWLRTSDAECHPPDFATVERVRDVAAGRSEATDVGRGWRVVRSRGRLSLKPPSTVDDQ